VEQNIDLVFSGVEYVACPRMLRGLELQTATPRDVERARDGIGGDVVAERVFVLVSGGRRSIVVAAGCRVTEHAGDIFDSPFS
jgi:ABC-type thiamine transport system ATPase subunit